MAQEREQQKEWSFDFTGVEAKQPVLKRLPRKAGVYGVEIVGAHMLQREGKEDRFLISFNLVCDGQTFQITDGFNLPTGYSYLKSAIQAIAGREFKASVKITLEALQAKKGCAVDYSPPRFEEGSDEPVQGSFPTIIWLSAAQYERIKQVTKVQAGPAATGSTGAFDQPTAKSAPAPVQESAPAAKLATTAPVQSAPPADDDIPF